MNFQILNMLFKCSKEFGHEKIKNCGLSDTECFICSYVYGHEACSQDDVVRGLKIDKTTAAKAMQSLEEKGFILRETDSSDRRKKLLRMTDTGMKNCAEIIHLHDSWLNGVMSALTEEEQSQFEEYCVKLLKKAEALSDERKRLENRQ